MPFVFRGEISSSKSLYNRALIAQSFSDHVQIHGLSQSEDVLHLQKALRAFNAGETEFHCGDGGTTFRFLAVRVSRQRGEFRLTGSEQLFSRPMKELLHFFDQVGVLHAVNGTTLTIKSRGWVLPPEVVCTSTESSQFLSAIALSSWDVPQDLKIELPRQIPSRGYLKMTLDLMQECGLHSKMHDATLVSEPYLLINANQKPQATKLVVEQDMSSLFALAVCAVMGGEIDIKNIPQHSMQPDAIFFDYFRRMQIDFKLEGKNFFIRKQENYRGIEVDLTNAPDLFPVLAVLGSRALGVTTLTGLKNLKFKESDRYENTVSLLKRLGRRIDHVDGGVMIQGRPEEFHLTGDFDPSGDHRMAMAAQAANLGGANLNILNKHVVNKSFPEFWAIMEEDV